MSYQLCALVYLGYISMVALCSQSLLIDLLATLIEVMYPGISYTRHQCISPLNDHLRKADFLRIINQDNGW